MKEVKVVFKGKSWLSNYISYEREKDHHFSDYDHLQRAHDKTKFNRFAFASMWIGIVLFCVFVWVVFGGLFL